MARAPEPIPPGEILYRGLTADQVDGPRVLPDAIDTQGTSVVRSKFGTKAMAIAKAPNGVAAGAVTPAEFPPTVLSDGAVEWEWFSFDNPLANDDSHAECRLRRVKDRPETEHQRPKGAVKERLRKALADRFRVVG